MHSDQQSWDLFADTEPEPEEAQQVEVRGGTLTITQAMKDDAAYALWVSDAKRGGSDKEVIKMCWPRVKVYYLKRVEIVIEAFFPSQPEVSEGSE